MIAYLPWIAVVLAVAAFVLRLGVGPTRSDGPPLTKTLLSSLTFLSALALFFVVALFCGFKFGKALPSFLPATYGFGVGILATYAVHLLTVGQPRTVWWFAVALSFPTAALGVTHWLHTTNGIPPMQLGAVLGAMITAFVFGIGAREEGWRPPCLSAVFLGALTLADYLGRAAASRQFAMTGLALGVVAAFAVLAGGLLAGQGGKREINLRSPVWIVVCLAILLVGAAVVAKKFLSMNDVWLLYTGSAVLAALVHWVLPEDDTSTVRPAAAAALWLAAATIAFNTQRGFGMSVALVGAVSVLAIFGNRRALLTVGPLAGLTFYRVFREGYPDASRAFDIGQHYAIIGVLAGILLPLIVVEWLENSRPTMYGRGLCAGTVWSVLMVGVPLAGALLLGPKGVVGYMIGLGLAPVVQSLKGSRSLSSLSVALGLGAAMTITYGWLGGVIDMPRDEKVALLTRLLLDVVALAALAAFLSMDSKKRKAV